MRELFFTVAHILFYILVTLLLITAQTSLWLFIFGSWPPPQFWLFPVVFIAIYHKFPKSFFIIYGLGIVASSQTSMPTGVLLSSLGLLAVGLLYFKQRIYWSGASYFTLVSMISAFFFPMLYWGLSFVRDPTPLPYPQFWPLLIQVLLTPIFSPLFYAFFSFFDKILQDPHNTESHVETL